MSARASRSAGRAVLVWATCHTRYRFGMDDITIVAPGRASRNTLQCHIDRALELIDGRHLARPWARTRVVGADEHGHDVGALPDGRGHLRHQVDRRGRRPRRCCSSFRRVRETDGEQPAVQAVRCPGRCRSRTRRRCSRSSRRAGVETARDRVTGRRRSTAAASACTRRAASPRARLPERRRRRPGGGRQSLPDDLRRACRAEWNGENGHCDDSRGFRPSGPAWGKRRRSTTCSFPTFRPDLRVCASSGELVG